MESNSGESRRASLPALSSRSRASNRLIIPQTSFNTPTLLEDVAEFELEPPYISQQTSSSAETSPSISSPGSTRPLSARIYRKHLNIERMHDYNDDFDEVFDSSFSENKKSERIYGSRGVINKSKNEKQKGLNLKNFIISKKGKIVENKSSPDNDKNRRATCPEIFLSSESDVHDINKTILRIYGIKNVGKHALTNKLANYAYPNKYPPVDEPKCLSFKKDYFSRKLQFLLNAKLHELEIIQGSALESEPFQKISNLYMVVYSIDNKDSFSAAIQTIRRLVENNRDSTFTQIILVGNKIDLQRIRKISKLEGKTIARIYNSSFIETSSLLGVNIDVLWRKILRNIQKCQGTEESLLSRIINNGRRITKSCEEIVAKLTLQSDSPIIIGSSQVEENISKEA
uniref:GTP-binding protein RAD n=1 Tax=Strongyloides papillosus TaxID=174720 RepID=A0A0N5C6W9_STREA